jgi:hypothetical protein
LLLTMRSVYAMLKMEAAYFGAANLEDDPPRRSNFVTHF